jgi:hypothetical protein
MDFDPDQNVESLRDSAGVERRLQRWRKQYPFILHLDRMA